MFCLLVAGVWAESVARPEGPVPEPTVSAPAVPAVEPATSAPPSPAPGPPEEVLERWDPAGNVVYRLVVRGDLRLEQTSIRYDDGGRPVERITERLGGAHDEERWTYDDAGRLIEQRLSETNPEGKIETRVTRAAFDDSGRRVRLSVSTAAGETVTVYTYDAKGRLLVEEQRGPEGGVARTTTVEHIEASIPPVPLTTRLIGGLTTNTDVRSMGITVGFEAARQPKPEQYSTDPLELRLHGSYTRDAYAGEVLDNAMLAGIGVDYNEIAGPLTLFAFTEVSRNPAANLDADLLLAPLGAKVWLVNQAPYRVDVSLAPVWNYRSITALAGELCDNVALTADGHCVTSRVRASARFRMYYDGKIVDLSSVTEYLPALNPAGGTAQAALDTESIFRETFTASVALGTRLTLSESVVFVRDPSIAAQADCAADPDNLLCSGMSLQTGASVAVNLSF